MPGRSFSLRNFAWGLLFFSAVTLAREEVSQEKIIDIRFVGNTVTQPKTMLREMAVHVGDPVDLGRIERSRQAIMDLGLFKEVRAELLPAAGGKILQITVEEKYYFLPIPRLNRNADGDISYGAQLRLDNMAGLNQQMKLTYEMQRSADANLNATKDLSLSYSYPRIKDTPYTLDFSAHNVSNDIDVITNSAPGLETTEYNHTGNSISLQASRFLKDEGPSHGWRAGGGVVWAQEKYQFVSVTPTTSAATPTPHPDLYQNNQTVSLTALIDYTEIKDFLYSRAGESYGYNIQRALPALGSDHDYIRHELYLRMYNPITEKAHHNLDLQFRAGFSDGVPGDAFTLGSSDTLRGYPRDSIFGKSFVVANVEYLAPLFHHKEYRGVIFLDTGNAYPNNKINFSGLKTSVGVGLRFNLKSFVKIQLRADFAYTLSGDKKAYAGTKDSF